MRALRSSWPPLVLAVLVAAATLAGCSDAVDDPGPADPGALRWEADPTIDLEGIDLAVGSKEPAAQRVLGWIAVEALRAADADVTEQVNLGGTGANREALLAGLIDLTWEYPAVGWTSILQRTDPDTDPATLADDVRERDLEENDVVWLEPAPAELGYGIVASPAVRTDADLVGVEDAAAALGAQPDEVRLCVDEQDPFVTDPDGLGRLRMATEVAVEPDEVVQLPADDLYPALEAGELCTLGAVRLSDTELADSDLEVLEGDGVFLPLAPAVVVRDDVLTDAPEIEDVLVAVSGLLTTEQVRSLAAQVTVDGEDPRDVARAWLVAEGLAAEPDAGGAGSG